MSPTKLSLELYTCHARKVPMRLLLTFTCLRLRHAFYHTVVVYLLIPRPTCCSLPTDTAAYLSCEHSSTLGIDVTTTNNTSVAVLLVLVLVLLYRSVAVSYNDVRNNNNNVQHSTYNDNSTVFVRRDGILVSKRYC